MRFPTTVMADPELLAPAITHLLQNAFKFTKLHTDVSLTAMAVSRRILINVARQSG